MTVSGTRDQDRLSRRLVLIRNELLLGIPVAERPDLGSALGELRDIAWSLEGRRCERCDQFYGEGGHGPGFCIDRRPYPRYLRTCEWCERRWWSVSDGRRYVCLHCDPKGESRCGPN